MMFFFLCFHTSQVLLDWSPKGKFICSSVLKVKTFPNVYKVTACSLALYVLTIPPFAKEQNLCGEHLLSVLPSHPLRAVGASSFVLWCSLLSLGS